MSFELQEQVAAALGYPDGGPDAPLPVERFMGDYYRHARAIRSYSELAIEQCQARVRRDAGPAAARASRSRTASAWRAISSRSRTPRTCASGRCACCTAFAVAQEHDVPLSRTAQRLVRENLHLIDDAFRSDPEATAAFLRILDSRAPRDAHADDDERDRACSRAICRSGSTSSAAGST